MCVLRATPLLLVRRKVFAVDSSAAGGADARNSAALFHRLGFAVHMVGVCESVVI